VAERARVQGYLASVWAVSAVVGPTLGGVFSEFLTWRAIFFVNVPLCLVAGAMLVRHLHEHVERRRRTLDVPGAVLLTIGMSALILGLLEGGQAWEWGSPAGIGSFVVGGLALAAFVLVERRADEPILPLWVLRRRLLVTTTFTSLGVGAMLLGLTSYVPTYLEGSLQVSPLVSGLTLATLTLGWPVAASLSGRAYGRFGFRTTILAGTVIALVGASTLAATSSTPSLVAVGVCCFVIGLGFGFVAAPGVIAAQSSVPWSERGVVTGTNLFARSIGSAVGVAVFGAVANAILAAAQTAGTAQGAPGVDAAPGSDPTAPAIIAASSAVFLAVAVCAACMVAIGALVPRVRVGDIAQSPAP
jgi:MFS family permease